MSEFSIPLPDEPILIGEPVLRPDGRTVTIRGAGSFVMVDCITVRSYTTDEVKLLGDGNFQTGVVRLGSAHYKASVPELAQSVRYLHQDLKKLKS